MEKLPQTKFDSIKSLPGIKFPRLTCSIRPELSSQIKTLQQRVLLNRWRFIFNIVFFTAPISVLIWRDIFSEQGSFPLFETLVTKSNTLQSQIISTVSCLSSFLDSLQMIAANASNSKGDRIWVFNNKKGSDKCSLFNYFLSSFMQLKSYNST